MWCGSLALARAGGFVVFEQRCESIELARWLLFVAVLLDRLDPRDREVVQLRFFERMGQEKIAEQVGVSQSYLSRLLRRILLDLREMAEQREAEDFS